jgi:hypothetical protein
VAESKRRSKTIESRPRHLPKVRWAQTAQDMAMRDALASELLGACVTALKNYGVKKSTLGKLARKVLSGKAVSVDNASGVLEAAQQLAEMIAKWGEHPKYLDLSGRPAVLSISGEKSPFGSLAREFFPNYAPSDVVDFGCDANAMERIGQDKVARLNDCVVFTGNSLLILAHSVQTVRRFLSTANFNRQRSIAISAGRPDRTSCGEISDKDLSEFIKVMRPQISGMVEMSDRWLGQRAKLRKTQGRRKRIAGVQAFLFFDS